jgi:hypothetical protein
VPKWHSTNDVRGRNVIALAFDPGVTTGHAFCAVDVNGKIIQLDSAQDKWNEKELYDYIDTYIPNYTIYESFEFRNAVRGGTELFSRNLIGVINLWHQQFLEVGDASLYEQTPSSAMGYWNTKNLKAAGLHQPGKEHANDAMRHMLYWLTFKKGSTLWRETENDFLRQFVRAQ